jgi:HSP20 family molecular chaperone IbpA
MKTRNNNLMKGRGKMKYYSTVDKDAFDIMDTLFNGWNRVTDTCSDWGTFPRYKARRTDEGLEVAIELPGVDPDKTSLSAEGDLLKVSGERNELGKEEAVHFERTLRDTVGMLPDMFLDPVMYIDSWGARMAVRSGDKVNYVSLNIGVYEDVKEENLDVYRFLQDAYEQNRSKKMED